MGDGVVTKSQRERIAFFKWLADDLPQDVPNRDDLYKAYMQHIEKIKKEKQWDD